MQLVRKLLVVCRCLWIRLALHVNLRVADILATVLSFRYSDQQVQPVLTFNLEL